MTNFLVNRFVKRADQVTEGPVRTAYGQLAGIVGILCNVLLFAGQFAVGTIFGSISITADAMNNLSDASGNVISLLGFRLAAIKPDANHPYGHGRFEYLASLAVSVLIVSIGLNLLGESVDKILHPAAVAFSWLSVAVLAASILVKLWLSRFNQELGRRIQSDTLLAAAADSRNDVLSAAAASRVPESMLFPILRSKAASQSFTAMDTASTAKASQPNSAATGWRILPMLSFPSSIPITITMIAKIRPERYSKRAWP